MSVLKYIIPIRTIYFKQQSSIFPSIYRHHSSSSNNDDNTITTSILTESTKDKNISNDSLEKESSTTKISGFAQAFERQTIAATADLLPKKIEDNATFAKLLRNSKFIDMGDPENKIVSGKIFHIVGDDLYIDFGWKFNCVCTRPPKNSSDYVRGAKVRLRLKNLELSTRFLGSTKDLTILEADCQLLGIISSPARHQHQQFV